MFLVVVGVALIGIKTVIDCSGKRGGESAVGVVKIIFCNLHLFTVAGKVRTVVQRSIKIYVNIGNRRIEVDLNIFKLDVAGQNPFAVTHKYSQIIERKVVVVFGLHLGVYRVVDPDLEVDRFRKRYCTNTQFGFCRIEVGFLELTVVQCNVTLGDGEQNIIISICYRLHQKPA